MRQKTINLFKFDELPEEVQKKVIDRNYDINVDYEWWEGTYEDAARVGIKITGFDIDRGNDCTGKFIEDAIFTANKIIEEHGEECETYKTAKEFLKEVKMAENTIPVIFEEGTEDEYEDYSEREDKIEELSDEFLKSILEDYLIILRNEYEYRTSEEAIIETIEANEMEFTEDGKPA